MQEHKHNRNITEQLSTGQLGEKSTSETIQLELAGLASLLQNRETLNVSQLAQLLNVPLDPTTHTLLENLNMQLLLAAAAKQAQEKKDSQMGRNQNPEFGYQNMQPTQDQYQSGSESSGDNVGVKAALAQLLAQQGVAVSMGGSEVMANREPLTSLGNQSADTYSHDTSSQDSFGDRDRYEYNQLKSYETGRGGSVSGEHASSSTTSAGYNKGSHFVQQMSISPQDSNSNSNISYDETFNRDSRYSHEQNVKSSRDYPRHDDYPGFHEASGDRNSDGYKAGYGGGRSDRNSGYSDAGRGLTRTESDPGFRGHGVGQGGAAWNPRAGKW